MDTSTLYILRYRKGLPGVVTSYISASSIEAAEEVGKHFCSREMNYRYIGVEIAVVATEDDLPEDTKREVAIRLQRKADNARKAADAEARLGAPGAAAKLEPPKDVKTEPNQQPTNDPKRK